MSDKIRVLILGGGFGGLYAALEFEKRTDPRFEVTVVNRENFFLFTPMLHWQTEETIQIQNAWTARSDRSPDRCGADPWREFFRISRMVSPARYLLEQTAARGKESACGDRLGVGCLFLERLRAVSRSTRARHIAD